VVVGNQQVALKPGESMTIGRLPDNTLVSTNGWVSARHASLEMDAQGNLFITDMKSSNGVSVNDKKIIPGKKTPIKPGDSINLGGQEAMTIKPAEPAAPVAPAQRLAADALRHPSESAIAALKQEVSISDPRVLLDVSRAMTKDVQDRPVDAGQRLATFVRSLVTGTEPGTLSRAEVNAALTGAIMRAPNDANVRSAVEQARSILYPDEPAAVKQIREKSALIRAGAAC
jgi:hypothetical protein